MKYEISKATAPAMPNLGKGTECIKLLLSQASKVMHEPLVPMFFPVLGAHMSGTEFQYPDNSWKEPTGMMANLVAHSGDNKGQLTPLVEAICRDFSQHDEVEDKKYQAWQKQKNTKGANKDKPEEPVVGYWFPPSDTTKPAFLKNAIALEAQGGRTQYFNLPEVEMADKMCGGHKPSPSPRPRCSSTRMWSCFRLWLPRTPGRQGGPSPSTCTPTATSPANGSSCNSARCCPR